MNRPLERWLVALAGGLTLISGVAIGVLHPTSDPLSWPKGGDELVGIILWVAAIFGLGKGSASALAAWLSARRRTSVTVGTVRDTGERHSPGESTTVSQVVVDVSYEVGKEVLWLEWVSPMHTNFQFLLDRDARKYPVGRRLNVYYDPKEPKNARLGRTRSAPVLSVALLFAFWSLTLNSSVIVGTTLNRFLFTSDRQGLISAVLSIMTFRVEPESFRFLQAPIREEGTDGDRRGR